MEKDWLIFTTGVVPAISSIIRKLTSVGENVLIISDEIHCDLTDPGSGYLPFAAVSERCRENSMTSIAPTKTFNLAGLQTAAIMVSDKNLRHKVKRSSNTDGLDEPNAFAVDAAVAAYRKGELWLDELREYLYENKQLVKRFLEQAGLKLKPVSSDATYLLWIDCGGLAGSATELVWFLRENTGLYLSDRRQFGKNGKIF